MILAKTLLRTLFLAAYAVATFFLGWYLGKQGVAHFGYALLSALPEAVLVALCVGLEAHLKLDLLTAGERFTVRMPHSHIPLTDSAPATNKLVSNLLEFVLMLRVWSIIGYLALMIYLLF